MNRTVVLHRTPAAPGEPGRAQPVAAKIPVSLLVHMVHDLGNVSVTWAGVSCRQGAWSAADARSGPGDGDTPHAALVPDQPGPVVIPARVLAGHQPVVRDQQLHRIRQGNDLYVAFHLDPVAEE